MTVICKNCKHYECLSSSEYYGRTHLCYARQNMNIVTGEVAPDYAKLMREHGANKCGPEGKLFEPKLSILDRVKAALTRS